MRLGFIGRIAPEKGLEALISALRVIPANKWALSVAGSGDDAYVQKLRELSSGLPVSFIGQVRPQDFYPTVDAVVVSSLWHDPAPRVAYEAGMHGAIPIVADRGGLPDIVQDGVRGIIYDPEDINDLRRALNILVQERERVSAIRAEWKSSAVDFLPKNVASKTVDLYSRAIASSIRPNSAS